MFNISQSEVSKCELRIFIRFVWEKSGGPHPLLFGEGCTLPPYLSPKRKFAAKRVLDGHSRWRILESSVWTGSRQGVLAVMSGKGVEVSTRGRLALWSNDYCQRRHGQFGFDGDAMRGPKWNLWANLDLWPGRQRHRWGGWGRLCLSAQLEIWPVQE